MVAGKAEQVLEPVSHRNPGVGVVPAEDQDEGMDKQEPVKKGGQGKLPMRYNQDRGDNEDRPILETTRAAATRARRTWGSFRVMAPEFIFPPPPLKYEVILR
jgi:hypothetical protein